MTTDVQKVSVRTDERGKLYGPNWSTILFTVLLITAIVIGSMFLWTNIASLLLLFSGILFASFLDTFTKGLARVVPLSRPWRLTIVVAVLFGAFFYMFIVGFSQIKLQATILIKVIDTQIDFLQDQLIAFGVDVFGPAGARDFSNLWPDPQQLFGHLQFAVGTASGLVMSTLVIVCLGLFFAGNPPAYRESVLCLVPLGSRDRMREVLNEMGTVLRGWLVGQFFRMFLVAVIMAVGFYWLGLPGAILLALLAGASNFIPYVGPLIATVPVALVAMPLGTSTFIWAVGFYTLIQTLEGYIMGPMIHRGVMNLPPAWTLLAIMVFGAMFGILGIALATPLLAVIRIAVLRLYVEDRLGDTSGAAL